MGEILCDPKAAYSPVAWRQLIHWTFVVGIRHSHTEILLLFSRICRMSINYSFGAPKIQQKSVYFIFKIHSQIQISTMSSILWWAYCKESVCIQTATYCTWWMKWRGAHQNHSLTFTYRDSTSCSTTKIPQIY